jgi:hypothetical protein
LEYPPRILCDLRFFPPATGGAGAGVGAGVGVVAGVLENHSDAEPDAELALFLNESIHPVPEEVVPSALPNGFKLPISNPPRIRLVLFFLFLFGIIILYYSIINYNIIFLN